MNDPQRFLPSYIERTAGSMTAPAIVAFGTRTIDPVQRDTLTPLDYIKARIPGLSGTLPARRDVFGRPVELEGALVLTSSRRSRRRPRNDPLVREMLDINARFGKMPRRLRGSTSINRAALAPCAGMICHPRRRGAQLTDNLGGR
ncbi:hypothetical protein FHS96_005898 [Sphingomonas zeicaulis]|uniref:hypothetical protein n=1 Tax=Sphingomonas zeicaulis TaxID=1632740 RepID=UPI003D24C457